MADHLIKGKSAEQLALRHLQQQGLFLQTMNYRCKRGEIDLIMRDGETLVFVEVRFRQSNLFGTAAESVTLSKQRKIMTSASYYLQQQHLSAPCRFDIVGITRENGTVIKIDWIKDAFQAH